MVRVLHLITSLGSGGAENQLRQLVLTSDRTRFLHRVVCFADADGHIATDLRSNAIEVTELGWSKHRFWPGRLWKLADSIDEFRPDLLHCWMYHASLIGTLASRISSRRPPVLWALRAAHARLSDYKMATRLVILGCRWLTNRAEMLVMNSIASKLAHEQLGFITPKMRIISNGVDVRRFAPNAEARLRIRRELGLHSEALLVGMCARFDPMKDHATFLQAAALVLQQVPGLRFLLYGAGTECTNSELKGLVRQNSLTDSVFMLGEREDFPEVTAALDVACLSSWTESFPNVVVEAMACGVPCVVTDTGDCRDIVGDTGFVVPQRNPVAFADALYERLRSSRRSTITLGKLARDRVLERYSSAAMAREYEGTYLALKESRAVLGDSVLVGTPKAGVIS